MPTQQQIFEFRGIDNLFVARVTKDDDTGYTCDTPVRLSYIAEAAKSTDSNSEAHYYDNKSMIVINSESADTITLTIAPPSLEMLAFILGKSFDSTTGMFIDSERNPDYFAIMYRTKGTDGKYRYVSRLKGRFSIPDEDNATEDDGTDTNNVQVVFTGIYTEHAKGKKDALGNWVAGAAKGIIVDTRYGDVNFGSFYSQIQTPDTWSKSEVQGIAVLPSTASLQTGKYLTMQAALYPSGSTGSVAWTKDNDKVTFLDDDGGTTMQVVGVSSGDCIVTATCNGKTDTCTINVFAAPNP